METQEMETRPIRVLLVDDHAVIRDGLRLMLELSGEFQVVGEARDGEEAVRAAAELHPDIVVMDVLMPNKDGVEACREIMEFAPDTRVVMLTASTEDDAVIEAVAAGATGYLQKVSGMDRLLDTVREVAAGELRVPAEVVTRVFAGIRRGAPQEELGPGDLTRREQEILALFCRGMSYARIAEDREVKPVTIRNAIYAIQGKLEMGSKQEMVVWAVRNGLLDD
jgi:DNA-binding NarL/FixJ family response regulator